jgi:hypothetical protein
MDFLLRDHIIYNSPGFAIKKIIDGAYALKNCVFQGCFSNMASSLGTEVKISHKSKS